MKNIKNIYKGGQKAIKFYNDYIRTVSEAKYKSIHGERPKILSHKQCFKDCR